MSEWLHHSHTKCAKCLRNIIEVIRSRKSIKDIQYYGKKRTKIQTMINKTELKIEQNELDKKPKVNLDALEG
jgi:hypothetical protein